MLAGRLAYIEGHEVVPEPKPGGRCHVPMRGPARHLRRDNARGLLVHHPSETKLRMIGADESCRCIVDGIAKPSPVGERKLDAANPEVPANKRQVTNERDSAQDWCALQ